MPPLAPAGDLRSRNVRITGAEEGGVDVDDLFLKCRRRGNGLENRTRVVQLSNRLILPLLLTENTLLLCYLVLGLALLLHLSEQVKVVLARKLRRGVQIVGRRGSHCEHSARLTVHYDTTGAVYYRMLRYALLEVLLQIVLQYLVKRQHKAVSVGSVENVIVFVLNTVSETVGTIKRLAVRAAEIIVVIRLKTVNAVAVKVREPDNVGRERAVWIVALARLLGDDTIRAYIIVEHHLLYKQDLGFFDIALYNVIVTVGIVLASL